MRGWLRVGTAETPGGHRCTKIWWLIAVLCGWDAQPVGFVVWRIGESRSSGGMRDTELFQAALGLSSPWIVLRSEFDPDQKQLDLHIGFARGSRFVCPVCGAEGCGVHDVKEKEWRHLNFF